VSGPSSITHTSISQDLHQATLSGAAIRLEPDVKTLFAPALPSNLSEHFAQNATVLTPPV
jgi:hypothetical protein